MDNSANSGTADSYFMDELNKLKKKINEGEEERNTLKKKISEGEEERKTLKEKISEGEEERKTLKKKGEEERKMLKKKISEGEEEWKMLKETLEAKIEFLNQEIEELKEKIVELKKDLKKARITNLEEEKSEVIKSLKKRITNLEEEERKVKGDLDILYISQVGYQFEQAICTYVLPDVFKNAGYGLATIQSLLEYLHGKNQLLPIADPSGKLLLEAKERWDKVCGHVNLPAISEGDESFTQWGHDEPSTPDIIKALCLLKIKRRAIAHPRPISLKLAGEKLPTVKGKMPLQHFKLIQDFIASIQKSIEKSGSRIIYSEHFQLD